MKVYKCVYFNALVDVLYEKGYFGFKDSAFNYVENLLDDVRDNLHLKVKISAPAYFKKYGQKLLYSVFKSSTATSWYVFYNVYDVDGEQVFLIKYIANNHSIAKFL
ncbi:MAG TPA: hypothetical protein IAC04_07555 [Candidatus Coprenecus stercoravium]|uniref:Uncharacterized protein n=1 Tax=Candidatus Coprenecus stercoravium TaxID=2840735 RepID=A0A9D2KAI8_9BACT|nr:hypothetical protein [Candidatus Coprenecus stercoravium]